MVIIMTDTTDIKALRERMMQQREAALTGNAPRFEDCELLVCDLLRALTLSNKQLEAERHRADYGQQVINQSNAECDRLINEIAEMKAKLANPVVLPERRLPTPSILTFSDAIKAINKAGFTVKGE